MDPRELAEAIIKKCPFKSEAFILKHSSLSINILDGEVESIEKGGDFGSGLRVLDGNRMGFAFSSEMDIDGLIGRAVANSRQMPEDGYNRFGDNVGAYCNTPQQDLYDSDISNIPVETKISLAKQIEKSARAFDPRITKTETAGYSEHEAEVALANSQGFSGSYKSNNCGGFASVICEASGQAEEGSSIIYGKRWQDFDASAVGREAAGRAVELFGGKLIKSEKLPAVFSPLVGAEFLAVLSSMLSAEAVQKGRSALAGKTGNSIAAKNITLIDDGTLYNGLSTRPFDSEGTPSRKNLLVEKGILKGFLHNLYTSSKDNVSPTGNGSRAGFKSMPVVSHTNFYLDPGKDDAESIISSVKKGIYVTRVMAMHSVNPVSGDFSVGAAGIMIENGKKTFPVRGITIAGNLLELLNSIEGLAGDLRFFAEAGNCGSPTLLIGSLSVGGE